jgi:hypothetical protein
MALISNSTGNLAMIVELSEDGIEFTIENVQTGDGHGLVLNRDQAERVRQAITEAEHKLSLEEAV